MLRLKHPNSFIDKLPQFRMKTHIWVSIASAGSFLAITISLLICATLFQDINSLYYEIVDGVDEFKVIFYSLLNSMIL